MYLPLKLDSVYHLWLTLSLDCLPMKMRFIPLEADIDAEVVALRFEWPQGDLTQKCCQVYSQYYHHLNMVHNQQ